MTVKIAEEIASDRIAIRTIRLQKGMELLKTTGMSIRREVGFNDPAYFSRAFQQEFGETPSEVREGS